MISITQLFTQSGHDAYFGEPVTQLEHALQCACLAEQTGADNETVVAAFLHDIGHLLPPERAGDYMDGYGTVDHEKLGADFLREQGFSEKVAQLIEHDRRINRIEFFSTRLVKLSTLPNGLRFCEPVVHSLSPYQAWLDVRSRLALLVW